MVVSLGQVRISADRDQMEQMHLLTTQGIPLSSYLLDATNHKQ
jgi:hypothetical protein